MSEVDPRLAQWCVEHLGSPAVEQFFGMQRISAVHGVRLADGRQVVLKVRGFEERLRACVLVHEALWRAGIPCPEPLAGPAPLAAAGDLRDLAVTAETWEGEGTASMGSLDAAGWGRLLAQMVAAAPAVEELPTLDPPVPWLHWAHDDPNRIWPPPASDRWDPHRIDTQIDPVVHEVARRAGARLLRPDVATLPLVAAHGDFEAQNCRWVRDPNGTTRLVIHDWDSIAAVSEAVAAGHSAMTLVSLGDAAITSIDENDAFLHGYGIERGHPFSDLEWEVAYACGAWVAAYNSAFEHLKGGPGPVTAGLHAQGAERLARADA